MLFKIILKRFFMIKLHGMFNKKKVYTIVFVSIFAICSFGFVWSWFVTRNIGKETNQALKQSQRVDVSNLVLTETRNAKKYWELYAKKGSYEGGREVVILSDIIGNFYDKDEQVILSFEASEGTYTEEEKVIILSGNVLAVAKDGSSILADRVIWKGQDEDIEAIGNVQINRNNELITRSDKAVFNADLTYFKIIGNSETRLYEKANEMENKKK